MSAEFGKFLGLLALVLCFATGALGLLGGHRKDARMSAAAAASAQTAFIAVLIAFAILVSLFLASDFSVAVVANNSHTAKPLIYKIAGVWGNHEGSMLLWCLISALFGALLASMRGSLGESLWARAVGMQGLVTASALMYTLFLSSPFARLDPAPLEGGDLNPLLQDPALAIHPPMLYLGYVGLSVPFSLAIAGLLDGKVDQAWARHLRPWTLLAWTCLTIGITLGSYWAYYELGWGGWWFWDPVENASFIPWLGAAALLHSAIVTERRGSLASWTILLAILCFGLALLGTFLVRSGVLTSVHAFAVDPRRGVAVLAIFAAFVGVGLALYAWRAPKLSRPAGFLAISREGALVLNNLGLAVAAGTVLLGTLYPLLIDAVSGRIISVGPPFFNLAFGPLMALLFVVLPVAPLLAWRNGDLAGAVQRLWWAAALALGVMIAAVLLSGGKLWSALGFGLGVWLVLGSFAYVWKRAGRLSKILALPLGVWAMTFAHAGLGILTIGAVAETGFKVERTAVVAPGQTVEFAGRRLTLQAIQDIEGPNYYGERATFSVAAKSGAAQTTTSERRYYPAAGAPTTEVGILTSPAGDFYIALGEPVRGPNVSGWTVRMYNKPLVQWIFGGAALLAIGGMFGLTALARRRARLPAEVNQPAPDTAQPAAG
jgi:cytochrome c-type biogenesis protein CcmF